MYVTWNKKLHVAMINPSHATCKLSHTINLFDRQLPNPYALQKPHCHTNE